MPCSTLTYKFTTSLHILSIITSFIGIIMQINALNHDNPYSLALPVSLGIAMLLRLPNQLCTSFTDKHAIFSVIGTFLALLGYLYIAYKTSKTNEYDLKMHTNSHSNSHFST